MIDEYLEDLEEHLGPITEYNNKLFCVRIEFNSLATDYIEQLDKIIHFYTCTNIQPKYIFESIYLNTSDAVGYGYFTTGIEQTLDGIGFCWELQFCGSVFEFEISANSLFMGCLDLVENFIQLENKLKNFQPSNILTNNNSKKDIVKSNPDTDTNLDSDSDEYIYKISNVQIKLKPSQSTYYDLVHKFIENYTKLHILNKYQFDTVSLDHFEGVGWGNLTEGIEQTSNGAGYYWILNISDERLKFKILANKKFIEIPELVENFENLKNKLVKFLMNI